MIIVLKGSNINLGYKDLGINKKNFVGLTTLLCILVKMCTKEFNAGVD